MEIYISNELLPTFPIVIAKGFLIATTGFSLMKIYADPPATQEI